MSVQIRYMGAKHSLAPIVADVIKDLPNGPCLDLFAGMCSVAGALAPAGREIWCNDIQKYAALVSETLVASTELPITAEQAASKLKRSFNRNFFSLGKRFANELEAEKQALGQEAYTTYRGIADNWRHAGNDIDISNEVLSLQTKPTSPYRLATLTYSHGYFGLKQAIAIDSLRYAIDYKYKSKQLTADQTRWCLTALLETASKICTAPGHFAQYLEAKNASSWKHIRRQRKRDVWQGFLFSLRSILPYGSQSWRGRNTIFRQDALRLPFELNNSGKVPRIVYADPPYSEAQYSRYYHVLESLVEYDYPTVASKGRYRGDRFNTPFSLASSVRNAFASLIKGCAKLGADLVISYPSNGLLFQVGGNLSDILSDYYNRVGIIKINHQHSTLGGKHGPMSSNVEELIFVARKTRQ